MSEVQAMVLKDLVERLEWERGVLTKQVKDQQRLIENQNYQIVMLIDRVHEIKKKGMG